MKRIILSLAGFATLFSLTATPVQSTILVIPGFQTQAPVEAETFFGTILNNGDHFVLSDPATKSSYTLDDTPKASRYQGMTVKLTGTLDMASNLIHIETIEQVV